MADIDRHLAEFAQANQTAPQTPADSGAELFPASLCAGALVIDLVTGEEGEILGCSTTHAIIPSSRG
jgi:hypothetical protein